MPEYVFKCNQCKKEFSLILKINEQKNIICPCCNSADVLKKYFPVSVHYKAKGFTKGVQDEK
jgi:putative FmdB family regulatory protein